MASYLIETTDLRKNFRSFQAVKGINLKVKENDIYGFLGPNGAGKSTTIRMLLGLIKPTAGSIEIFGEPLQKNRLKILRQVGSLVESPSYYGHLTAYENLDLTRHILSVSKVNVEHVLKVVGLEQAKHKLVKKFSLGMKQRLGIAQALLGNPQLLILDEPTNGLDPAGIHEIRALIKRLPMEMGVTVLISSHILSEIELIASHVGIIHQGQLIYQDSLERLRQRSKALVRIQTNNDAKAMALLSEQQLAVTCEDNFLSIHNKHVKPAEINKMLITSGFEVNHVSFFEQSLEDIFLNMTSEVI
ncbi:ABC transporter ATP-binding protein [Bacillus sp. HMF5848]|uniref:ABC transporter ATP-binding protein n=1 Tax=Bacillus sp. HMF5848 TaxID=2495421 RepID=UPI000F798095|nr:ABC transporter ATP-binding protein [Bacillus sp. HMF5848]RSK26782.1 ABC transporter ATP-binding protein [Bacillus sp. HMF5848]